MINIELGLHFPWATYNNYLFHNIQVIVFVTTCTKKNTHHHMRDNSIPF